MREIGRRFNEHVFRNTIEENKSPQKPKQQLMIGKKNAVNRPDESATRNKEEIIKKMNSSTENCTTQKKN